MPLIRYRRHYGSVASAPRRASFGAPNSTRFKLPKLPRLPRFPKFTKALIKKLFILALFCGALFLIFSAVTVAWISRGLPDPNKLTDRQIAQSTKIYDRTGEHLLYEIYQDQKRTMVALDQISPWAVQATVAIEDKHFYEHRGVRLVSILRAGFNNLIGRRSGSGGASTLTQQLIKNTIVGSERTFFRKVKEAVMAIRLEKKYSKDEILKMYLNEIPYGSTNYGIEAASQSYFHKSASDLALTEAAALAAIPKAPSRYLNNLNSLRDRRDTILRLMYEQGYVTEEQKNEAQGAALRLYRGASIFAAPHFVLYVKQLLADRFGEKTVDSAGLKVITTLDYNKQRLAEEIIKEMGDKYAKESNANNAALVAIDPKNGQILSMVGSRDFYNEEIDGQFNVAVLGKRQPGSSLKPFVYAAAFAKGYTPETMLYDILVNFDQRIGGDYTPKNYDDKEHGLVTMRKALQGSLNIPSVKTLYLVGVEEAIEFAKHFGYTSLSADAGLSLVLGGSEVNLLEHTNAYAALANNGVYNPYASILKVTDSNDGVLFEWKDRGGEEATKPELAALISNVLSDNQARAFIFGLSNTLVLPDRPVAAKTGTTDDYKDAWTMGYTPQLAAGVWVGNTAPAPMKGGGNKLAGAIWNKFMREALKDTPVEQFPEPPPNDADKPILRGGGEGGLTVRLNRLNGKLASSSTPERLITEKTYLLPHDILHYVRRDDPRGPVPDNPADDPQYENWENALQEWVAREQTEGREVSFEEPPTEYDDTTLNPALAPTLEIIAPAASSTLNSRQMDIRIKTSAPRGVARVSFQIDGTNIGYSQEFPFTFNYYAKTLTKGEHTLKVMAEDDLGNAIYQEVGFDLQADFDPPSAEWFDGSPLSLSAEDFPRVMQLVPFRWEEVKEIKIYLKSGDGAERLIYALNQNDKLFNNNLSFTWKRSPGAGRHILRAVLTDNDGRSGKSALEVEVK